MLPEILSNRSWRIGLALGTLTVAAVIVSVARTDVLAHGGHEHGEIAEFDLDSPRVLSPETAKHIGLKVEETASRPIEDVILISGIVRPHPDRHRMVVSRVAGRLLSVHVQVGSPVKKGDILAQVDSPELARNLYEVRKLEVEYQTLLRDVDRRLGDASRLRAEIDALKNQVEIAKVDFERGQKLSGEAIAEREVQARRSEYLKLDGEHKAKSVELEIATKDAAALQRQAEALKLSRAAMLAIHNVDSETESSQPGSALIIKAESDGVVLERTAIPGKWIQAGENLLTVADYSSVQVEGELPESLIPRIEQRSSDKVRIRPASDPSSILEGKLAFIAPQLEPIKRTAHVIVDVPNPKGTLRGEAWVDLAIVLREDKTALTVPRSAVIVHGPMHFVFLEIEGNDPKTGEGAKYQKHDINPGLSNDLFVEIKDGLFPGDRVVSQGAYSLTQLRPKPASKASATTETPAKSDSHAGHSH